MRVHLRQVLGRAQQGLTRPFLCVADDGETYYVKGADAGWNSLVAEWVAGRLGRLLELPIPEIRQVEVEEETLRYVVLEDKHHLGVGIWFGSRYVPAVGELTRPQVPFVSRTLQAKVLLFDWWVANGDRVLTEKGGNPNLLWNPPTRQLHLIDHNLAFDPSDLNAYLALHAFQEAKSAWTKAFQAEQGERLRTATEALDQIWAEMPPVWTNEDCELKLEMIRELLWRFTTQPDRFWNPL